MGCTVLLQAAATLLELRYSHLWGSISPCSFSPPSPGSPTWMREGVQQDTGTLGTVAPVGGAEMGVGGDEHARGP